MRLGLILTLSFLLLALVVALVAYLFKRTSDTVQTEIASIRQGSIATFVGAAEMAVTLQKSQLAAQQIITARLQALVEPSHDTGPLPGLEDSIDEADKSLDEFENWLKRTDNLLQDALSAANADQAPGTDAISRVMVGDALGEVEKQFAVYRTLMDRFTHLAEWHPTDQVSEFFADKIEPFYEFDLSPRLREFDEYSRQVLTTELDRMETAHRVATRRNAFVAVASFAGALLLGLIIARSISKPLGTLQAALARVAKGELSVRVDISTGNEIELVADAFNKMAAELEASTVSRSYLDSIIQSVNEMLIVTDPDGKIRTVNPAVIRTLGCRLEELVGEPLSVILVGGENHGAVGVELAFKQRGGDAIPVYCSRSELRSQDGRLTGVVLVALDLRPQKENEARLKASIAEKEVLLREVHHRVKNNLQIVSSLLNLQDATGRRSGATERILRESRNRIRSMALIHEQLYKSEDLARIDFRRYVEELGAYLTRSFDLDRHGVGILLDVESVLLSVDRAIPCGMIINELVANGVEHAYPEGEGEIRVSFHQRDGRYILAVADNGIGLPPELDPANTSTLGLRLVRALGEQLAADLQIEGVGGTEVTVAFDIARAQSAEVPA